jgi:hypothetical protein
VKFIGLRIYFGTFAITVFDKPKFIINNYFVQFSLKDMWKYPHREERYNNGSYVYGWGFFYFGKIISREKNCVKEKNCNECSKAYRG